MQKEYLTVTQAAKIKRVTRATVYQWLKRNALTTFEIASRKFIVKDNKFESIQPQDSKDNSKVAVLERRVEILERELGELKASFQKLTTKTMKFRLGELEGKKLASRANKR